MSSCKFRSVVILKDEYLGRGAYGVVYRARCDQLVCAAKYLHPTFFESNDPGNSRAMVNFQNECAMLSQLHHPNIVQYLGTHREEGINTIILLMEEMDSSLHTYLEKHKSSPLPFCKEVDFVFDIALALDYLHANNIHHRDLSSKNVLLQGDSRVKVSDFGVAKLRDPTAGYSTDTPCPGNILYMPPEVLKFPPCFENTLDEFSLGVLMIQIMNRKEPSPTDLHIEHDQLLIIVPETDRRKEDIQLCDQLNPLLQIALCCISNDPKERPSAEQISRLLALLQTTTEYKNTNEIHPATGKAQGKGDLFSDFISIEIEDKSGLLKEIDEFRRKLKEKDHEIEEQKSLLAIKDKQLKENHALNNTSEQALKEVNRRLHKQTEMIEEKEKVLKECLNTITVKEQTIRDLEGTMQRMESSLENLKQQREQIDQNMGSYITEIDLHQTQLREIQLENEALRNVLRSTERQLREKDAELHETRARLIERERELVSATLKGLQSLKTPGKRRS